MREEKLVQVNKSLKKKEKNKKKNFEWKTKKKIGSSKFPVYNYIIERSCGISTKVEGVDGYHFMTRH